MTTLGYIVDSIGDVIAEDPEGMAPAMAEVRALCDDLAVACEERGFESVWFPEHTHIPAVSASNELPKEFAHMLDPFISCVAAAIATKKIRRKLPRQNAVSAFRRVSPKLPA